MTPERERAIKLTADKGMSPECRSYFYEVFAEVDQLRAANEKLIEHKRLLFEENGRLLAEKEAGLWDANHPLRVQLAIAREALESLMSDKNNCGCEPGDSLDPEFICGGHNSLNRVRGGSEI